MRHLALSALGRDRPGIVAAVTAVLVRHGVNVEDSRMAILRGEFAMALVLGAPAELELASLEGDLTAARAELGLEALTLAELGEAVGSPIASAATHIVSVYGADHPGIVHGVAAALAARGGEHHRPDHSAGRPPGRRAALRHGARGRPGRRRRRRRARARAG